MPFIGQHSFPTDQLVRWPVLANEWHRCDKWHVIWDRWQVTSDTWHVTQDMWHVTTNFLQCFLPTQVTSPTGQVTCVGQWQANNWCFFVLVLLSKHSKRFSISRMRDFHWIGPYTITLAAGGGGEMGKRLRFFHIAEWLGRKGWSTVLVCLFVGKNVEFSPQKNNKWWANYVKLWEVK